jgi:hypothetical protein
MDDTATVESVVLPLLVSDGIIFARTSGNCLEVVTLSRMRLTTI